MESESASDTRQFHRRSLSPSTEYKIYKNECIICGEDSFLKGSRTREKLTQCSELRSDDALRNAAIAKQDNRVLAIMSRDLVAAEGQYHRTCYRSYTRDTSASREDTPPPAEDTYANIQKISFEKLFAYIREDLFETPRIVKLKFLTSMLTEWMIEGGVAEVKPSTRKHVRRHLENEFGKGLIFQPSTNMNVLVYPDTLSRDELAKQNISLQETVETLRGKCDTELIKQVAHILNQSIIKNEVQTSWPPLKSEIGNSAAFIPHNLKLFLQHASLSRRVQRLVESVGQDIAYGVTRGKQKPPKHLLLPYAIKTLTGSSELITIVNRLGHGVSYSQVEELETALCMRKLESQTDETVALPQQIRPLVPTTVAFDNIDRLEETLSGAGTSHRVNGIVVQPAVYGPFLPQPTSTPMEKRRSIDTIPESLPVYNAGGRVGPPPRTYIELEHTDIATEARKKNLVWILSRYHSSQSQGNNVPGWTGFNIATRDSMEVNKDTIGYLPTINAPATEMSTIHEVLVRSKKIMNILDLKSIVVVCDQAIYAKATEILWKHMDVFSPIVPRLGTFHTVCNLQL